MEKAKKKITRATEIVDSGTGELIHTKTEFSIYVDREDIYVKMYAGTGAYDLIPREASVKVLDRLLAIMDYENKVNLMAHVRRDMAKELGITLQQTSNCIRKLKDWGLLREVERNSYVVNPYHFARGTWDNVRKLRNKFSDLT